MTRPHLLVQPVADHTRRHMAQGFVLPPLASLPTRNKTSYVGGISRFDAARTPHVRRLHTANPPPRTTYCSWAAQRPRSSLDYTPSPRGTQGGRYLDDARYIADRLDRRSMAAIGQRRSPSSPTLDKAPSPTARPRTPRRVIPQPPRPSTSNTPLCPASLRQYRLRSEPPGTSRPSGWPALLTHPSQALHQKCDAVTVRGAGRSSRRRRSSRNRSTLCRTGTRMINAGGNHHRYRALPEVPICFGQIAGLQAQHRPTYMHFCKSALFDPTVQDVVAAPLRQRLSADCGNATTSCRSRARPARRGSRCNCIAVPNFWCSWTAAATRKNH